MKDTSFFLALILSLFGIGAQYIFGSTNLINHITFTIIGIGIYIIISKYIKPYIITNTHKILSISGIFFLIALLVFAEPVRGSRRWFSLGSFNLQPSVIFIPFFILTLSALIYKKPIKTFKKLIIILLISALPPILVFAQPDLGTSVIIFLTLFGVVLYNGIPLKYIALIAAAPIPAFFLIPKILKPYQYQRILSFLNPNIDPYGINYNSLQSIIAIGSGGFFGKGIFNITQSRLQYLPEAHTDFVFASFTETFGFLGSFFLIAIFALFIISLVQSNKEKQPHPIAILYSAGIAIYLFLQFAVNIGMNLRLFPVVGVPLPLISYGGSTIITVYLSLAIRKSLQKI